MILPSVDPNLETQVSPKPPLHDDANFAAGKIAIFQYGALAIFLFLVAGFWRLQVQNPQIYDERALQNSVKSVPIVAPRGRILDRDGRVIVDNHSSFSLLLARETLKEEHLRPIAQGLDLDYDDLAARVSRFRSQPRYIPIVIKEELTPSDLSFVDSHHDFFPEMELIRSQRRLYPQNGMMAHTIGYTGEISPQELDLPEFAKYNPGEVIGKFGLERQYNDVLMGVDGQRQVVVDNRGQVRETLATKPAIPGKDLRLTIDLDLQAVAELAMDGKNGAVVALDPKTGEVLAIVSRPTFDPNKFAVRIRAKDWKEIADNPDHPMLNRAIQSAQAPGSTFKPIMALAGLETATIDDQFTVHCTGGASFYGHYYRCWQKGGHGTIALHNAIVRSCDVFFYTVGNKMGIDNIAYYGDVVGFGHETGIDLPNERTGVMPSPEWKLRNYRQKWYAGETISVSIGQGALTVTPLQLARAYAGIVNGGVWHHPHLLKGAMDRPTEWALSPANVKAVIDGMYGVVNEGGTGARAQIPGIEVCGKTGTAQVASADYAKSKGGKEVADNAWFVGYAPRAAPEIVVVALFDHGAEGYLAAPIVRDVLKAYFDKKTRLAAESNQKQALHASLLKMSGLGLASLTLPGAEGSLRSRDQGPGAGGQGSASNAAIASAASPDEVILEATAPAQPEQRAVTSVPSLRRRQEHPGDSAQLRPLPQALASQAPGPRPLAPRAKRATAPGFSATPSAALTRRIPGPWPPAPGPVSEASPATGPRPPAPRAKRATAPGFSATPSAALTRRIPGPWPPAPGPVSEASPGPWPPAPGPVSEASPAPGPQALAPRAKLAQAPRAQRAPE